MEKDKVESWIEGRKVIYKRFLDAPVGMVFEAWSNPEELAQWWGPDGFTITTGAMDFSEGGTWEFTMHGPDGTDFKNRIRYLEIRKPHSIRYNHTGDSEETNDVDFTTSLHFEESGDGTLLTMVQEFSSAEELERLNSKFGAIEGGKQHITNLANYLKKV